MKNGAGWAPPGIAVAGTFVATDQAFALAADSRVNPAASKENITCFFISGGLPSCALLEGFSGDPIQLWKSQCFRIWVVTVILFLGSLLLRTG
jgi:hypothetical protein